MSGPDFVRKNVPDFDRDRVVVMVQAVYNHDGATGDLITKVYDMTCDGLAAEEVVQQFADRRYDNDEEPFFENRVESSWETLYRA